MKSAKVAVALSGGMDSLSALLLLRERGFAASGLHGIFLPEALRPPDWLERLEALQRQAVDLDFALRVLDLSADFSRLVIQPFVRAYAAGLTPNPCAACNAAVKFGLLRRAALDGGSGWFATGHYARLEERADGPALLAASDASKDQSYFLALVPRESLGRVLFPLAEHAKSELRAWLEGQGVSPVQPGESQEICFIPGDDYRALLPGLAKEQGVELGGPGDAVLPDGRRIGRHQGLWRYTEGQRRGLGLAYSEPLYVLGKNRRENTLLLGGREEARGCGCRCGRANYLVEPAEWPATRLARIRYRQPAAPAEVKIVPDGGLDLFFTELADFPAPGQLAAVYAQESGGLRVLAGAVIESAVNCGLTGPA